MRYSKSIDCVLRLKMLDLAPAQKITHDALDPDGLADDIGKGLFDKRGTAVDSFLLKDLGRKIDIIKRVIELMGDA